MTQLRSVIVALMATAVVAISGLRADHGDRRRHDVARAAVPPGAIQHVMGIDLENDNFATTFGASSPAVYLNSILVPTGELIANYFATSHVSLGNYISRTSIPVAARSAPNRSTRVSSSLAQ